MLERRRNNIALFTKLALICLVLIANAFGQYGTTTPDRGAKLGNSFSVGQFDTVNGTTGALMLNFPLASLPAGRGSATAGVSLTYNSKLYKIHSGQTEDTLHDLTYYDRTKVEVDPKGGWRLNYGTYSIETETRWAGGRPDCGSSGGALDSQLVYQYKVKIVFPDGSTHEMIPYGHSDALGDRYFKVALDGMIDSCQGLPTYTTRPVYYSRDGSFLRLETTSSTNWTLYFPDGSKVVNGNQIYDKNGNYVSGLTDQLGRTITSGTSNGYQTITSKGVGGEDITWKIKWKQVYVFKTYEACNSNHTHCHNDGTFYAYPRASLPVEHTVVDEIVQPDQLGGGAYKFTYNGSNTSTSTLTNGWGEVSGIELPSGATITYTYSMDGLDGPSNLEATKDILKNQIVSKTLKYDLEYDGQTVENGAIETWGYSAGDEGSTTTAPDGSMTSTGFATTKPDSSGFVPWDSGLTHTSISADGTKTENIWERNIPTGCNGGTTCPSVAHADNPYIKTTFTSIKEGSSYTLTAIKDFTYDMNGNVTEVREYDFVPYSSVPRTNGRPTGLPSNASTYLKRVTKTVFYNQAPTSGSTSYSDANIYIFANPSKLLNLPWKVEVRPTTSDAVKSYTEMLYDYTDRTQSNTKAGNLIETRVWDDSTNASVTVPLTDSNSIKTESTYNNYGQPITTKDANNVVTQITYGNISTGSGTVSDLYPTQTVAAHGTALARTSTAVYDFHTGLTTSTTDEDNDVTNVTEYDDLGRRVKAISAQGTGLESWTVTQYDDTARRIIVKSDLETKDDGKKVATQFFDQVGRVRLAKTLEDAATQSAINETDGIKVQTRYKFASGYTYQLASNPYRAPTSSGASAEETMGWTLSTAWSSGKRSEVQSFSGAGLPSAFGGSNSGSTGIVRTDIDANATTVTDQAGKLRRSITNGIGQLIRVDEPNGSNQLGTVASPNQATAYEYDTLGKLVHVQQGVQHRWFMYSSLGHLLRVKQPEQDVNTSLYTSGNPDNNSWTAGFSYDNNGNVLTAKDAKNNQVTNTYDLLNRPLTRTYSDGTPTVTNSYDGVGISPTPNFAIGKLTKVTSTVSESRYTDFDEAGRVKQFQQVTDGQTYTSSYEYNLSGALVKETYPSGRVVENEFDASGDLAKIFGKATTTSTERTFANNFTYTPDGKIERLRLGSGVWESAKFNSRLQVKELSVGWGPSSSSIWKMSTEYGELQTNGTVDGTMNSGNIGKQAVTFDGLAHPFVQAFKYDALQRLTEARETVNSTQTWKEAFDYDRYGNRTAHQKYAGGSTEIPQTDETRPEIDPDRNRFKTTEGYTFDANGNVTVDHAGRQFVFNGDNKQTQVKDAQQRLVGKYFYDGEGKRVKKLTYDQYGVEKDVTVFVYSTGKLIAEYTTEAPPQNPTTRFTITDGLGSPRVILDSSGDVVSRRDFLPFGEEIATDSTYRTTARKYGEEDKVRQKFTGYERDIESSLDFAQARMYNFQHGRFTAVDPLLASGMPGNPQTWNRYTYVLNNPLYWVDPTGLIWGKNDDGQVRWFDKKLGKGFSEFTPDAWQYEGTNGRIVQLDANSSKWNYIDPVQVVAESNPIQELAQAVTDGVTDGFTGIAKGVGNSPSVALNGVTGCIFNCGVQGAYFQGSNPFEVPLIFPYNNEREASYGSASSTGTLLGLGVAGGTIFGGSTATSVVPSAEGASATNHIYSARVLMRGAEETGPYHNFPMSFDSQIISSGTRTSTSNFVMYRQPGTINGRSGVFEIGARPSPSGRTEVIRHRFFRPSP